MQRLYFYYGEPYSGKTTHLIRSAEASKNFYSKDDAVVILKPATGSDSRLLSCHNPKIFYSANYVFEPHENLYILITQGFQHALIVYIDDAHLLTEAQVLQLSKIPSTLICAYGLRSAPNYLPQLANVLYDISHF